MLWCNFAWQAAAEAHFPKQEKPSPGNNCWNIYECNLTIESWRLLCSFQITPQHPSATHLRVWNLRDEKKAWHLLIWISLIFSNWEYTFPTFSATGSYVTVFVVIVWGDLVRLSWQHVHSSQQNAAEWLKRGLKCHELKSKCIPSSTILAHSPLLVNHILY